MTLLLRTVTFWDAYGIRMLAELSFFLSQFRHVTDGRTENFAIGKTASIECSAVTREGSSYAALQIEGCPAVHRSFWALVDYEARNVPASTLHVNTCIT